MSVIYHFPNWLHFGNIRKIIGAISRPYESVYFIGDVAKFKVNDCISQAGESLSQEGLEKELLMIFIICIYDDGQYDDDFGPDVLLLFKNITLC